MSNPDRSDKFIGLWARASEDSLEDAIATLDQWRKFTKIKYNEECIEEMLTSLRIIKESIPKLYNRS